MTAPRRPASWPIWAPLIVLVLVLGFLWLRAGSGSETDPAAAPTAPAASPSLTPDSGLATVEESRLPAEARRTLALIRAGGPYPHRQDDQVFQNREGLLPSQPRGYYREYTVLTPGENDRGPRRIIGGQGGDRFWTADHYDSFQQIKEGR